MKSSNVPPFNSGSSAPRPPTREQIEALAHAIWVDRGCPSGREREHWVEAERQLGGVATPPADQIRLDPDTAPAARIDRELDRIVSPPGPRSPTSL